jgi:DNA-3-methyladenine glycosylase
MLKPMARRLFVPSASEVAPALLGCWLVRNTPNGPCGGPIVEAEAYLTADPACHAYGGPTTRNRVMWGKPGLAYVYFIYGNHYCVNVVCRPEGVAEAVLIRAIESASGIDLMRARRPVKALHELTNGPGKLCAALGIDRALDGVDLCDPASPLFLAHNPQAEAFHRERGPAMVDTRIGITKAADLPLRFYLRDSPFLSRKHAGSGQARLEQVKALTSWP